VAINPEEFGASFQDFLNQMRTHKKPEEAPFFVRKLEEHFGANPASLPVVSQTFPKHNQANLHMAMEAYVAAEGRSSELFGVIGLRGFRGEGLADLVKPAGGFGGDPKEGPVEYANVTLDNDRVLASIERGLFLVRDGPDRSAVFVHEGDKIGGWKHMLVEVMARGLPAAERFLSDLREAMQARNVYRGHMISLTADFPELSVKFHRLPTIDREAIILPEGLLERVERQTVEFGRQSGRLRQAGRHLKRGLLLHGAPGTGKTLTLMYLVSSMRDRTALLLSVKGLGLISQTCAMARTLQPSIVILEDVDLIAEDRTNKAGATPMLFELLNEMDGLSDDADVLFLLTTNRPHLLEPALASRPGRVDQAIEIPVPDESCRRRLFDLYGRGLTLQVADMPRLIARTEGASGAFIRELLRKAALFATDSGDGHIVVTDHHLDAALHELVVQGGEFTRSLLGFQSKIGFGARDRNRAQA
jgi:ATPase family associated with various cellular activities (AAA)